METNQKQNQEAAYRKKGLKLALGIVLDGIGFISFSVPFLGEVSDVVWAPIAGFLMTRMYKGSAGKAAGVITFVEEILPGFDFIPTFTLTWLYTYLIKKEDRE